MIWYVFITVYLMIAAGAMYMTWREHVLKPRKNFIGTLVGLITCTVWPAAVAAVSVGVTVERMRSN